MRTTNSTTLAVVLLIALAVAFQTSAKEEFTVAQRLEQYGTKARARLAPYFEKQKVAYPPSELVFIGLKEEKTLEIYAKSGTNELKFIRAYPILAASGVVGPKRREGDRQEIGRAHV